MPFLLLWRIIVLFPEYRVFIDGGGNDRFLMERYLKNWLPFDKIFVFEPNPLFYNSYKGSNLIFIPKAIWTEDCKMPLYLSKDSRQVGSSIIKEKLCRIKDKMIKDFHEKPIEVECIDFSKWIKDNIKPYWKLTVKLDIEGAEYDVLWKLIKDGTIKYIKELYVEFHANHLQMTAERHNELITALNSCGVNQKDWN